MLASDLKPDMTADSVSDVVEQAIAFTGMRQVPTRIVPSSSVMLAIRHIYCAPHHPQTNGKTESFHETLWARMNLLVYTRADELRRTMQDFVAYYNHRVSTGPLAM